MALNNLHSVASLFTHRQTHTHANTFFLMSLLQRVDSAAVPSPPHLYRQQQQNHMFHCVCVCWTAILPSCISNETTTLTSVFYIFIHPPQVFSCHQSKCTIGAGSSKNTQVTHFERKLQLLSQSCSPQFILVWLTSAHHLIFPGGLHIALSLSGVYFVIFIVELCQVFMLKSRRVIRLNHKVEPQCKGKSHRSQLRCLYAQMN